MQDTINLHDYEQKVVLLIKNLKRKGNSLRAICRKLEQRGYKTKTVKTTWLSQQIAQFFIEDDI